MPAQLMTIAGAGPVGTLLGILLAQRGHRVRVIDRRPDPRTAPEERGRSINLALAARGIRVLRQAGVLPAVSAQWVPMPGRMLHETDATTTFIPYGQREDEVIYALGRNALARLLVEAAAREPNIELVFGLRCLSVDHELTTLHLRNERDGTEHSERFNILFAADGARSSIRTSLQRHGMLSVREDPLDHEYRELIIPSGRDGQYCFEPHALHIWPRGGYMLIALPNADRTFTATLFLAANGDPSFASLTTAAAVDEFFRTRFADALAATPDLATQFLAHPHGHLATVHVDRWQTAGRVLLLGDAAHAIVPFHGQGLNCGFEDCRVLLECMDEIATAGPDMDLAAALQLFAQRRPVDSEAIATMALENYIEMRDGVRAPDFVRRKQLAAALERVFPRSFIPRYSMVMFHDEIPYSQALQRGRLQDAILDEVIAKFGYGEPDSQARNLVELRCAEGFEAIKCAQLRSRRDNTPA